MFALIALIVFDTLASIDRLTTRAPSNKKMNHFNQRVYMLRGKRKFEINKH